MSTNTQKAVHRIKNEMRLGAKLAQMNTIQGKRWFLVGSKKSWIADDIARLVIREPDVFSCKDGLFGETQTYAMENPKIQV